MLVERILRIFAGAHHSATFYRDKLVRLISENAVGNIAPARKYLFRCYFSELAVIKAYCLSGLQIDIGIRLDREALYSRLLSVFRDIIHIGRRRVLHVRCKCRFRHDIAGADDKRQCHYCYPYEHLFHFECLQKLLSFFL